MSQLENEVVRSTDKGTYYDCGRDECDKVVLDAVQHPRALHTEYFRDTLQQTLYCSNECLVASVGDENGGDA